MTTWETPFRVGKGAIYNQWEKGEVEVAEVFANTRRLRTQGWECDDDKPTIHTDKKKNTEPRQYSESGPTLMRFRRLLGFRTVPLREVVMWKNGSVDKPLDIKGRMLAGWPEYRDLSSSLTVVAGTRNPSGKPSYCRTYRWHWCGAKSGVNVSL